MFQEKSVINQRVSGVEREERIKGQSIDLMCFIKQVFNNNRDLPERKLIIAKKIAYMQSIVPIPLCKSLSQSFEINLLIIDSFRQHLNISQIGYSPWFILITNREFTRTSNLRRSSFIIFSGNFPSLDMVCETIKSVGT